MITIKSSKTADTRTCDAALISKEVLMKSSMQHISDVAKGFQFFQDMMKASAVNHDFDKLIGIDSFHSDFITGFKEHSWWDNHRKINRHHLTHKDGIPKDVNLIDVLDMVIDCVMAGMGRTGSVYTPKIAPEVLMDAFNNTVNLLIANVEVVEDEDTNA
jgi:hypothetical protein